MPKVVQQTGIKVGLDSSKYKKNLKGMEQSTTQSVSSMCSSFGKLALSFVGVASVTAVFNKIKNSMMTMEKSVASLSAVTGSLETARIKFEQINSLSREVTQSFDELNQAALTLNKGGLSTSNAMLKSLSQISVGTGKSLESVAQAVTNASMGQLKGLRQLGINAVQEGDKIKLTYQGVTTEIGNSVGELEDYITKFASDNFAETLDSQMKGVTGQVKRLGDAWDDLWRSLGEQGGGNLIVSLLEKMWKGLDAITEWVNSEPFSEMVESWGKAFGEFTDLVSEGWGTIGELLKDGLRAMGIETDDTTDSMWGYFSALFAKIGNGITSAIRKFKALREYADGILNDVVNDVFEFFNGTTEEILAKKASEMAYDKARVEGKSWLESMRISAETYQKELESFVPKEKKSTTLDSLFIKFKNIDEALEKEQATKKLERQNKRFEKLTQQFGLLSSELVKKYQQYNKKFEKLTQQFGLLSSELVKKYQQYNKKIGGVTKDNEDNDNKPKKTGGRSSRLNEEEREVNSLRQAYERLIESIRSKDEAQLSEIDRENNQYLEQINLLNEVLNRKIISQEEYYSTIQSLEAQHLQALSELQDAHYQEEARKRQAEIDKINEMNNYWGENSEAIAPLQQFTNKLNKFGLEWNDLLSNNAKVAKMSTSQIAGMYAECNMAISNYFGNIASGFEQSTGIYKGLFALQKGFAVASSMISIYQGVANAMSAPYPQNLVAWMGVLSQGMSIISQLKSINYAGAYDKGGFIPSGSFGLVGEVGPEIVTGPANITSRKRTEDLLSNSKSNITVNLIEDSSRAGQVNKQDTDEETIINVIVANIRNGGDVDGAIAGTYNLSRVGA